MGCRCRKFAPKGVKPKGPKPQAIRVSAPKGSNQAAGYAKKYGIKIVTPKVTKAKPTKAPSARVARFREQDAKALAKANANPCKCTP